MSAVYALYPDGDSAQRAVNGLQAAGVAERRDHRRHVGEPIEDQRVRQRDKATWMW